jgi:hypothetical protein
MACRTVMAVFERRSSSTWHRSLVSAILAAPSLAAASTRYRRLRVRGSIPAYAFARKFSRTEASRCGREGGFGDQP